MEARRTRTGREVRPTPRSVLLPFLLVVATALVYARVVTFDFVNLDDTYYVTENPHVRAGFTPSGIAWAFRSYEGSNWHPLTWLSLMLDAEIGGTRPWIFHLTNLLLHAANALLLFLVLDRMTRERGKSAFVAALFAVHPLHVESVAWIAERKDVLSTLFGLLALLAYARYVERKSASRYAVVALAMTLSLMAKPMLVTLPLMLLLLDVWPLRRLAGAEHGQPRALILEKIPLFLLAAASSGVTLVAQRTAGALGDLEFYPFGARVSNAVVAYATYLGETFWPAKLAVFYPHPGDSLPVWRVAASGLFLLGLTALPVALGRTRPYLLVGWLWYVVTLVPVIGLVQVGMQALADRYTYVPLVGIFVVVAWGAPELLALPRRNASGSGLSRHVLAGAAAGAVSVLSVLAHVQAGHWRDSVSLFGHAIRVASPNAVARNCLGRALVDLDRDEEARAEFSEAVRIHPEFADARSNLAGILIRQGKIDEGIEQCRAVLRIDPRHVRAHTNLGLVLMQKGEYREAAEHFAASLAVRPNHGPTRASLGAALLRIGQPSRAREELERALALDPGLIGARIDLGVALAQEGRLGEATREFRDVIRRDPGNASARDYLDLLARKSPGAP